MDRPATWRAHMTRTALVTGGNRGIGYEICRELAAAGHTVILTARDARAGDRAAASLTDDGLDVRAEQLDVSDPVGVADCARRLAAASVDIDVLVNNAAIYTTTSLLRVDEDALVEAFQINLIG